MDLIHQSDLPRRMLEYSHLSLRASAPACLRRRGFLCVDTGAMIGACQRPSSAG